eukprot:TRINITY_DN6785_c0_g1_i3.p1 TRINITY_DN6785_c0_g1~~TRINITY_DN6785_c0_g1_i3.p1  ORF type:complete len:111 (+),score=4.70 TRINITY_DN6785_c0_g1_i3:103-435(+)
MSSSENEVGNDGTNGSATMVSNDAHTDAPHDDMEEPKLERGSLSCAFRDWTTVPPQLAAKMGSATRRLDLSHNLLTELSSITPFCNLEELVRRYNLTKEFVSLNTLHIRS